MPRLRRPGSRRTRGVAASAVLLALAGCAATGPVRVSTPTPSPAEVGRCRALLDGLPRTLAGQPSRPVDPEDGLAAAWGDPAIVLTCGDFAVPDTASCAETDGVGWWVPEEQYADQSVAVVMTTIGRTPAVRVTVPADYRPPASVMVGLARPIRVALQEDFACV